MIAHTGTYLSSQEMYETYKKPWPSLLTKSVVLNFSETKLKFTTCFDTELFFLNILKCLNVLLKYKVRRLRKMFMS